MVCDMPKWITDTKDPLYREYIFRSHVGTEDRESLSLVSVSLPSSLHTSCHTVRSSHSYRVLYAFWDDSALLWWSHGSLRWKTFSQRCAKWNYFHYHLNCWLLFPINHVAYKMSKYNEKWSSQFPRAYGDYLPVFPPGCWLVEVESAVVRGFFSDWLLELFTFPN